jgi:transposase InsO family protein
MTTQQLSQRQARWATFFADFDFVITHRPGVRNGKADLLSRRVDYQTIENPLNFQQLLRESQIAMLEIINIDIKERIRQETISAEIPEGLQVYNGIAYHRNKMFIPSTELQIEILKHRHDGKAAGHFGIRKTIELVERDFWWPNLRSFVAEYVKTCDCIRSKASRHKALGTLQPLPIPSRPWASISTDFIVGLPKSNGYDAISVWICRETKMAHFIPCNGTVTANDTTKIFLENIYRLHGLPEEIISDRGPQFIAKFWKRFCQALGITVKLSSAYHPQTNGQTERTNQILEQYLRCYCNYDQNNWAELLSLAEFAYNNSIQQSINCTPFFANYGYHPQGDGLPRALEDRIDIENLWKQDAQERYDTIKQQLEKAQLQQQCQANKKRKEYEFQVGDQVWLRTTNIHTRRPSKKLDYQKIGPFSIVAKIGKVAYQLQLPATMNIHNIFHISLLEPYYPNNIPGRMNPAPMPVEIKGEVEYKVEAILDDRLRHGQRQYLVHWKGYSEAEATWEPSKNISNASEILAKYQQQKMFRVHLRRGG